MDFTPEAMAETEALGLTPEAVEQMVQQAAPHKGNGMNRRFEGYGFLVGAGAVHHVTKLPESLAGQELLQAARDLLAEAVTAGIESENDVPEDPPILELVGRAWGERCIGVIRALERELGQ